uniref:Gem-associated protein 2 n=1 Tax=Castor canadensis TaxID=51338 RepID=A0A8B7U260_CASCN|nr:gem-associated protein 2 [Castor canadensis]
MNQATVTSVLEYLSNWFGERDFTPELGRWLYALLACLEKPLLPEAHSLIRQLARRCSEVRLLVDSKDDERVPALNLLICLVSSFRDANLPLKVIPQPFNGNSNKWHSFQLFDRV